MGSCNDKRYGLLLSHILGAGQVCSWGSLYYSFPLLAVEMQSELGWSKSMIYFGASLGMLMTAIFAYPVGIAIDRGYGRLVMSIASLFAAVLLAIWSNLNSIFCFYVVLSVLGVLQACTLYEGAFAVISQAVESSLIRSRITVITLWGGFASTIFIPLEQFFINEIGWRSSLRFLCLINLLWAFVYFYTIRNSKITDIPEGNSLLSREIEDQKALKNAVRSPIFWLLAIALTLYSVMFTVFIFHAYPILQEKGLSSADSVKVLMVLGPIQVFGRLVISRFASNVPICVIGSFFAVFFPLVFIALFYVESSNLFIFIALIASYGLANGIFTIVRGLVVPEMVSQKAYGAINGLLTIPTMIARAVGPGVAASLWMVNQSYQEVLIMVILVSTSFAISFWLATWLSNKGKKSSFPTS